jgi:hypothetical protein
MLAAALERRGWSVWWDPELRSGQHYDAVIEQALQDAKVVIVLWSSRSVTSQYVRDEATFALNREKLMPVAIEQVTLPFRFAGLQTTQLRDWDGSDTAPGFLDLVDDIQSRIGPPASVIASEQPAPSPEAMPQWRASTERPAATPQSTAVRIPWKGLLALVALFGVAVVASMGYLNIRSQARIQATQTAEARAGVSAQITPLLTATPSETQPTETAGNPTTINDSLTDGCINASFWSSLSGQNSDQSNCLSLEQWGIAAKTNGLAISMSSPEEVIRQGILTPLADGKQISLRLILSTLFTPYENNLANLSIGVISMNSHDLASDSLLIYQRESPREGYPIYMKEKERGGFDVYLTQDGDYLEYAESTEQEILLDLSETDLLTIYVDGSQVLQVPVPFQDKALWIGYRLPEKILSYTASIQHELPFGSVLTVAYVGSQGRNLFLRSWANGIIGVTQNPTTGVGSAILEDPRFAQLDYKTSGGTDHYDSMQTSVQRRFAHGLTLGGQWTWAHSLGDTGGSNEAQTAQNPFDFEQDRGNNAFDVRHSGNMTALYELPFGTGRKFANTSKALDYLVGGWQLGGVVNARTGLPIDITIARNDLAYRLNGTNLYVNSPVVTAGQVMTTAVINNPYGGAFRNNRRPSVVAGVDPFLQTSDRRYVLNPAAFSTPAPGTFGNLGRWALHGPGLVQLDFTLQKRFLITERVNLEFRSEFYNILNRANFANPPARLNNSLGNAAGQLQPNQPYDVSSAGGAFGVANSTVTKDVGLGTNRQIQFSLRLSF